jgi:hypothetical protein
VPVSEAPVVPVVCIGAGDSFMTYFSDRMLCVTAAACPPIVRVDNGIVLTSDDVSLAASVDDMLTILCKTGYSVGGRRSAKTRCQADFTWSVAPYCTRM